MNFTTILFLIPMILGAILSIWIYLILDRNGYSPHHLGHPLFIAEVFLLIELIKKTDLIKKKILYSVLMIFFPITIIATFVLFFHGIMSDIS